MILLAVKGRIAQDTVPTHDQRSLVQRWGKLRVVVAGSGTDGGRRDEVAGSVADDGELGPQPGAVLLARPLEEVRGSVLAFQAGRVDGRLRLLGDQAAVLSAHGGLDEEENDRPFFSSRCWALCRVE